MSKMPAGRVVRLLFCRRSEVSAVSLSNAPAGRVVRLLLSRRSVVSAVSLSNTPAGRLARELTFRCSSSRAVRSSKMRAGKLVRPLEPMSSDVSSVRPSKSPARRLVRVDLFWMMRLVMSSRSVAVTCAQVLPVNSFRIAARISAVRLHTPSKAGVTALDSADSAPEPTLFTARTLNL